MPNPQGNPDFGTKYVGKTKSEKTLRSRVTVRIEDWVKEEIDKMPTKERNDFLRRAIAKALKERQKSIVIHEELFERWTKQLDEMVAEFKTQV